jgi:hypothetical protein
MHMSGAKLNEYSTQVLPAVEAVEKRQDERGKSR